MGFLKRFFRTPNREPERSSFEGLPEDALEAHLGIAQYGAFRLTEAVRPSYDLKVIPEEGYRHDAYVDAETRSRVPVLMAAVTRRKLFQVFMDLLDPLGKTVDVVLETSHACHEQGHDDLFREHIDLPVLRSILWEYEDLLTNDGCTGIAVLNPRVPSEVQFDEHKLLIAYGHDLTSYERVLREHCITYRENMRFITSAEHIHSSSAQREAEFAQLACRLGLDDFAENAY